MSNIWFTSDLHFAHPYVSSLRGFGTCREDADTIAHDATLVDRWNKLVGPEDTVWVLGDIVGKHQDLPYALQLFDELPGVKHLVAGNHDAVSSIHRSAWKHQKTYLDVFASVQNFAKIRINGHEVLLSHFPYIGTGADHTEDVRYEQFRLPDHGTILLHGHTHSSGREHISDDGTLQVHVGVDAWGMAPVSLGTITKIINEHNQKEVIEIYQADGTRVRI